MEKLIRHKMKNIYTVLSVAIIPFLISIISESGSFSTPTHSDIPELVVELSEQQVSKRRWKTIKVDSLINIGESDVQLLRPLQVVPSELGLLVVDFGDRSVKLFDWSGRQIRKYGRRGRGPGEFVTPTDVDVADSTIWVADGSARRLSRIEKSGVKTTSLKTGALRVASIDRTSAFVMTGTPTGDGLFKLVRNGEVVSRFGQIIKNQPRNAISLDGRIRSYDGNMFYSSFYGGFILSYNKNGELRFGVKTLNSKRLPEVHVTEKRGSRVRRIKDRDYVNSEVSVDSHGIHVFSIKGSLEKSALVIDTYSLKDGSYKYSTKVRHDLRKIRAFENMHVGVREDTLATAYWYRFRQ